MGGGPEQSAPDSASPWGLVPRKACRCAWDRPFKGAILGGGATWAHSVGASSKKLERFTNTLDFLQ
eukprot:8262004-Pyramimonas_sp.AAC.1